MKSYCYIFFVSIIFSCTNQAEQKYDDVFVPYKSASYSELKKKGYAFVRNNTDVPIMCRRLNDSTRLCYQFESDDIDKPICFISEVKFTTKNIDSILSYIENRNCRFMYEEDSLMKNYFSLYIENLQEGYIFNAGLGIYEDDSSTLSNCYTYIK